MKPKLSIVIVSFQVREYVADCLRSIQNHLQDMPHEVIVVDNFSADDSTAYIKTHFPDVILIENHDNLGFARATNQGILKSNGEYILLLNPDTVVLKDSLQKMLAFAETRSNLGALGCRILNDDLTIQSSCRNFPDLKTALFEQLGMHKLIGKFIRNYLWTWDHNSVRRVDSIKGACMMIPKKVFKRIGLLDEHFFLYGEEMDFCKRIANAGMETWFLPEASIVHFGEKSTEINSLMSLIELHKAQLIFFKKHNNHFSFKFYKRIIITGLLFRIFMLLIPQAGYSLSPQKRHIKYNLFKNVLMWHFNHRELLIK